MKHRLPILLLALLAFVAVGCDSDGDDTPPEERIVGTWQASRASLVGPVGIRITVLDASNADQVTMTFRADDSYSLDIEGPVEVVVQNNTFVLLEDGESQSVGGTYALVQDDQVRFTVGGVAGAVDVDYDFRGDNRLVLSVENTEEGRAVLALLLGDAVPEEVLNLIQGGELELERQ